MDEKRIQQIFEYIEQSNIELDPDPISRGPKYLNRMVAECRNMTNEVQKFEREASRYKMELERNLNLKESEFEIKYNHMMSSDPEVIQLPSVKDREAKVQNSLKDLKQEIMESKLLLTEMGHVVSVINSKLRELKGNNSDLRLQIRLVGDEIQTGNYWGDSSDSGIRKIQNQEVTLDDMVPKETLQTTTVVDDRDEDYDKFYEELLSTYEPKNNTSNKESVEDTSRDYDDFLDS